MTSWEEFLSKAQNTQEPIKAPVGFGDIATLRYSSGTTGKPKGAIFKHENLRYMAESLVSIMPWKARNRPCSYLSFLPMGHVVEGILGNLLTLLHSCTSRDLLLRRLPKPSKCNCRMFDQQSFFSVPRVYEKVWEALEKNSLGRLYLHTNNRLLKGCVETNNKNMPLLNGQD